ncbi:unnamed protein product [Acanthoscelides obtectus]|uniref:Uncharacterized protein n=1 Tax=Acanthoscelides obtectus TaxID=200917 RepID=A0A9P0KV53_ACAOB|nr:unnamed protein product [Acanthoscelides obtectus]CAK1643217.1 hypothetical protein AOBTE_LOCUS13450 [Acanthoscelides obtectus]
MELFIGVIKLMGVIHFPTIESYWKKTQFVTTKYLTKYHSATIDLHYSSNAGIFRTILFRPPIGWIK